MPVDVYDTDDLFTITIKKALLTNPDNSWVNRYEVQALEAGTPTELLAAATKCLTFERELHSAAVLFSQLSISTWSPDSKPYDPTAFISSPISQVGMRVVALDLLPLNQTLSVTRVAQWGRFGHLFFRGALYEDEQSSPAGQAILTAPTTVNGRIQDAIESATLQDLFFNGDGPLRLVMVNKNGTQVRPIVGFVAGGISSVPTDHAWYNRTTPTP